MSVGVLPSSEATGPPLTPVTVSLAENAVPLNVPPASVTLTPGVALVMVNVVVDDATPRFIEILQSEADRLVTNRGEFLASFSEPDLNYLVERWSMKVGFCQAGDMKWGIYLASKKS